jgi:hypothetical protein
MCVAGLWLGFVVGPEAIEASLFLSEKLINFFDKLHESVGVLLRRGLFRELHPPFFGFTLHARKGDNPPGRA